LPQNLLCRSDKSQDGRRGSIPKKIPTAALNKNAIAIELIEISVRNGRPMRSARWFWQQDSPAMNVFRFWERKLLDDEQLGTIYLCRHGSNRWTTRR
jgi:hypothetical protein